MNVPVKVKNTNSKKMFELNTINETESDKNFTAMEDDGILKKFSLERINKNRGGLN